MRNIPQCYYNKSLLKLIDRYIEQGFSSYSKLDEIGQEDITAQCIEILGKDAYGCIIDHEDFSSTISHFTKFLRTANQTHAYDLVQTMCKNAREHFVDVMDALFAQRDDEKYTDTMRENGLRPCIDRINGEISWRKSA